MGPASTTPLTTVSQIDPIKAIVTVGESAFTDFFSRYPDATKREALLKRIDFELLLGSGNVYPRKGKFYALDRNLDIAVQRLPGTQTAARTSGGKDPNGVSSDGAGNTSGSVRAPEDRQQKRQQQGPQVPT